MLPDVDDGDVGTAFEGEKLGAGDVGQCARHNCWCLALSFSPQLLLYSAVSLVFLGFLFDGVFRG